MRIAPHSPLAEACIDFGDMDCVTLVEVGSRYLELHYDGHARIPHPISDYVGKHDGLDLYDFDSERVLISFSPEMTDRQT